MKALILIIMACAITACMPPEREYPVDMVIASCHICGHCQPSRAGGQCSTIDCDCCNVCVWTMICRTTGEDFPFVLNQCDTVLWIEREIKQSDGDNSNATVY